MICYVYFNLKRCAPSVPAQRSNIFLKGIITPLDAAITLLLHLPKVQLYKGFPFISESELGFDKHCHSPCHLVHRLLCALYNISFFILQMM